MSMGDIGGAAGGILSGIGGLFKKKPKPASRWGNTLQDLGMSDLSYYMDMFGDPMFSKYFNENEKAAKGWGNTFGGNSFTGTMGRDQSDNPTGYGNGYGMPVFGGGAKQMAMPQGQGGMPAPVPPPDPYGAALGLKLQPGDQMTRAGALNPQGMFGAPSGGGGLSAALKNIKR